MSEFPVKRTSVAWGLWMTLGWMGAHKFYLDEKGGLMLAWFVGGMMGAAVVSGTEESMTAFGVWFASVLLWWTIEQAVCGRRTLP